MTLPSLIVFGPQTTWPSSEYLFQLRGALILEPRLAVFLSTIKELPLLWQTLLEADPRLKSMKGVACLKDLQAWIDHGVSPSPETISQNVLTMPFTILIHFVQYIHFLDAEASGASQSAILNGVQAGGIQGFCAGLLSAIAVACAKDADEVGKFGAIALRLAFCIGAYVDLDGVFGKEALETTSLAVRWKSDSGHDRVLEILKQYPDAYVSVLRDATDVTITAPKGVVASLSKHLSTDGILVMPTGLEGRFHTLRNQDIFRRLSELCASTLDLSFPHASELLAPTRSNSTSQPIKDSPLHLCALRCILLDLANWHLTISAAASQLFNTGSPLAVSFGIIDSIPASTVRESGLKVINMKSTRLFPHRLAGAQRSPTSTTANDQGSSQDSRYPDHSIAVIGMACKFPGADSLEEFWQLLVSGTSMLSQMPADRFATEDLRRSPGNKLKFWGNFVRDADAFDHRFFKKSSREAASMDPQQRLLLQVAYDAIESSGYFGNVSSFPKDIGCFLGVCSSDYNDNVACHPPNAYSSLGTLRAFLSGKISHFFGWSGPSITMDSACSSSSVAIHSACKAIQNGECSQALAGGVSLYTSPFFYQNLAAASFLSQTGATKPFDAKGDGYCRGEGVGLVVLKKLSAAISDGDNILGVITGSAVNQNSNVVSITVPHSPSQAELYHKAVSLAGIQPTDVSYVEAHGTGTPVGDPIEFESIRRVFGGAHRKNPLFVSSVKGNIGHLEGSSGVAGLIKTLLMMQKNTLPIQASHQSLNPKIPALEPDRIVIPLRTQKWDAEFQAACVNNYGAAGSNAAIIVLEPPKTVTLTTRTASLIKYPIFVAANSELSLKAYCTALQEEIQQLQSSSDSPTNISDFAFNLSYRQNPLLPHVFATSAGTFEELHRQLIIGASGTGDLQCSKPKSPKPVVLTFGGQVNNCVGLNKLLYESSVLLRTHLDHCNAIMRSFGMKGIYPEIFQTTPVADIISLQCMVFSLQYSCSRAWMDSGLKVDALIGHSLGQLTALCVAGSISLEDGIRLISGRASLMQQHWGAEAGTMVAVEANIDTVLDLVSSVSKLGHELEVACYNGPTSHVLVGTVASADALQKVIATRASSSPAIRCKRLSVTHGFHSVFTEPMIPHIVKLASKIVFKEPIIPVETCSNGRSWSIPTAELISEHTRAPVYFGQAVERLASRLGTCTWLEAGSSSSIIGMVRHVLEKKSTDGSHIFQSVNLTADNSPDLLVDATVNLWKWNHQVQFWHFHRCQKDQYTWINLPPYQFEKNRHWLAWEEASAVPEVKAPASDESLADPVLLSFLHYQDRSQKEATFLVDPRSNEYKLYVEGHAVLANPLCPAPLYVELISQAASMLTKSNSAETLLPLVENLEIKAPLGIAADRSITISLKRLDGESLSLEFIFSSNLRGDVSGKSSVHATGQVALQAATSASANDFTRYERLVGYQRCDALRDDVECEAIQGAMVYKVFAKVVQYYDYYKGVRSVFAKNQEVAGKVVLPSHNETGFKDTVTQPLEIDNFIQVAGLHVNNLNECGDNEVFVCTKVDRIQIGAQFTSTDASALRAWDVYSNFAPTSAKEVVNDVFVFDPITKKLSVIILGAHFTKVLISSLTRVLSRANDTAEEASQKSSSRLGESINKISGAAPIRIEAEARVTFAEPSRAKPKVTTDRKASNSNSLGMDLRKVLHRVTEVPVEDFKDDSTLEELGVDSLMITEVLSEVCKFFAVDIPVEDFQNLLDVKSLCDYLGSRGCGSGSSNDSELSFEDDSGDSFNATPMSESDTTSSLSGDEHDGDDAVAKLAALVSDHLELPSVITRDDNLAENGLDSLLCIELATDIKKLFGCDVDFSLFGDQSIFGDLADMVCPVVKKETVSITKQSSKSTTGSLLPTISTGTDISGIFVSASTVNGQADSTALVNAQQSFEDIRFDYDVFTAQTGFAEFWKTVYPTQARLVLAYTVEAFAKLGSPLSSLKAGEKVSPVSFLSKHTLLMNQLRNILEDGSLVTIDGADMFRSGTPIDNTPSQVILQEILQEFPHHASEHKLLNLTGARLADCLTGTADPLQLLFRSNANKELLSDVYANGPMYKAISGLLCSFFSKVFEKPPSSDAKFHILELGGGTGGTTKHIIDLLVKQKIPFTYTFTDLSGSLVTAARKRFSSVPGMAFQTLDIEKTPSKFSKYFHAIISTNCIHATRNLTTSMTNIYQMLRHDGFVSLVEFTRNMYWFDLVFGLLDGWWLYEDGRKHVLADEAFWENSMRAGGFKHVTWTDGPSEEARTLRIITAFPAECEDAAFKPRKTIAKQRLSTETVVFKRVGDLILCADIYYPPVISDPGTKRPIALMIHGGGYCMFTRKEAHPRQVKILLAQGFIPVSVDYRFAPEINIIDGSMTDVCDALRWVRESLPTMQGLNAPAGLRMDGERVAVVGWSTGGHLAMTLGYTARLQKDLRAPEAILAFYCPTNYESDWWKNPIYPRASVSSPDEPYDLLEGVRDEPIADYYPPINRGKPGTYMSTQDTRWRFILHMNWKAQFVPVLTTGLPSKRAIASDTSVTTVDHTHLPMPAIERIRDISPYSQIRMGNYRTPTFLVHGTADDLIPWQHSQDAVDALRANGVEAGISLPDGARHLFDTFPLEDPLETGWAGVHEGYGWLGRQFGL